VKKGSHDAFVAVLQPSGANLQYATYLGGGSFEEFTVIAVDTGGNAYVAGRTHSLDFPILDPLPGFGVYAGGDGDVFVTKLRADGQLGYSTYLGGLFNEGAYAIGLDGLGDVYVAGATHSANFPVKNALQPIKGIY
jgi:hypothetical protein